MTLNIKIHEYDFEDRGIKFHAGMAWCDHKGYYKPFCWSAIIHPDDDDVFPGVRMISLNPADGDLDFTRGTDFDETDLPEEAYDELRNALNEYVGGL